MAMYRYRAATPTGTIRSGALDGVSREDVIAQLRRLGWSPIEAIASGTRGGRETTPRVNAKARQGVINTLGELAVLLEAGLELDRALTVCVRNIANPTLKTVFVEIHGKVKQGFTLSRAMSEAKGLFPPVASAMCEAGEADGRLGVALTRLAESLDRAESLRQTIISSLVYPAMLMVVATGVILLMLLVVVPQFESLFSDARGKLPVATQAIMGASRFVRSFGLVSLAVIAALVFALRQWMQRPGVRLAFDRMILKAPQVGGLIVEAQTAAFARTLGSLVDGGVPLPTALSIAQRSVTNQHMTGAIAKVTAGLKEGGGLSGPLAATQIFPRMAISFLRTGEETARLGLMLGRLADVLDRSVRTKMQRLIGILTPSITVFMAAIVATTIASIMSAILGFNDLALAP